MPTRRTFLGQSLIAAAGLPAAPSFLRGDEPYKYGFGPLPEDVFNIRITGRATGR
jgi:hypothetical protein